MLLTKKIKYAIIVFIAVTVLFSYFGLKTDGIQWAFTKVIHSIITSAIVEMLIVTFGGKILKKYSVNFKILGFKIRVSYFSILAFFVGLWIFE